MKNVIRTLVLAVAVISISAVSAQAGGYGYGGYGYNYAPVYRPVVVVKKVYVPVAPVYVAPTYCH